MNEQPPEDPTHRSLWAMGFNEKERDAIIRYATTNAGCNWISPLALGNAILGWNEPQLPKSPWYARLRLWHRKESE